MAGWLTPLLGSGWWHSFPNDSDRCLPRQEWGQCPTGGSGLDTLGLRGGWTWVWQQGRLCTLGCNYNLHTACTLHFWFAHCIHSAPVILIKWNLLEHCRSCDSELCPYLVVHTSLSLMQAPVFSQTINSWHFEFCVTFCARYLSVSDSRCLIIIFLSTILNGG